MNHPSIGRIAAAAAALAVLALAPLPAGACSVSPALSHGCGPGESFDTLRCRCAPKAAPGCPVIDCRPGFHMNYSTCGCEPRYDPYESSWGGRYCPAVECRRGYRMDPATCRCKSDHEPSIGSAWERSESLRDSMGAGKLDEVALGLDALFSGSKGGKGIGK